MNETGKRLYRSTTDKMLCGVCGGLAEYFNIDPVLVRLIFVGLTLFHGAGALAYVALCILMPEKPATVAHRSNGPDSRRDTAEDGPPFEPLGSRQN